MAIVGKLVHNKIDDDLTLGLILNFPKTIRFSHLYSEKVVFAIDKEENPNSIVLKDLFPIFSGRNLSALRGQEKVFLTNLTK
jgi:hypothetical protein